MHTTKAHNTIINYLGIFKGLFTRRSLEMYFYEALFILEQDYEDLKKTLMTNEVFMLALTLIENEMFPSDMFMPNIYNILFKGAIEILNGKLNMVYPEKILRRFAKAISICIEKEKLNTMESIEKFLDFFQQLKEGFKMVSNSLKNYFISNFVDFIWFNCSDFNYYLNKKPVGTIYRKEWMKSFGQELEFFLQ